MPAPLEDARARVQRAVQLNGFQRSRIEILSSLMKLRRICDHPRSRIRAHRGPKNYPARWRMPSSSSGEAPTEATRCPLQPIHRRHALILREALTADGIGSCTIEGKTRDRRPKSTASIPTEIERLPPELKAGGTGLTSRPRTP